MDMRGKRKGKRDSTVLVARTKDGNEVERHELSLQEYYQGIHQLIDSSEYRASRRITVIEGQLFDPAGNLFQEFRNMYTTDGAYEGGRTVHADGTVNED